MNERGSFLVADIGLVDFRNYGAAHVSFRPGLNLVAGPNGHGKTNLLEAVHLLSRGQLMRPGREAMAIRDGAIEAQLSCRTEAAQTEIHLHLAHGQRKRAIVNGTMLKRSSDLLGRLPTVAFSASDLMIVAGDPSDRRGFIDIEVAQARPAYLTSLATYKRALEHRNALLKTARDLRVETEEFLPWESRMAESGETIRQMRREWLKSVIEPAASAHAALAPGEALTMAYEQNEEEELVSALTANRTADIARGSTSVGPHRDDIAIEVNGLAARHFGSQGQQRTSVIAIKLAVMEVVAQSMGKWPVLLLDDVFSDLDEHRRSSLIDRVLETGSQVLLSCTETKQAGRDLSRGASVFQVRSGTVVEQ